jgi:predicted nuclease of predicted toxin-antitoxin system
MRVLLDENVDRRLKPFFDEAFEVLTVRERGCASLTNGVLLTAAQVEFDAFVTMDQNIPYQQNVSALQLGLVIIRAFSNRRTAVEPLMPEVNRALTTIQPGQVVYVGP